MKKDYGRKKYLILCFYLNAMCFCIDDSAEQPVSFESADGSAAQVDHRDSVPSIVKREKIEKNEKTSIRIKSGQVAISSAGSISLTCYKSGICQVKDARSIATSPGINEIIIEGLYPGLMEESLSFRTPKKGKISILSYKFNKKDLSREGLLLSSIGGDVFFRQTGSDRLEKGKLLSINKEKETSLIVVESDRKCFLIPIDQCVAVDEKTLTYRRQNSLYLSFESSDSENVDLEINYLTPDIYWKHICLIDVFEKLDRVDIFSEAFLMNNTDFDLKNVNVIFDSFAPSFSHPNQDDKPLKAPGDSAKCSYARNLSLKKNSNLMCMLRSVKEQKPKLEYIVKIPAEILNSDVVKEVPVGNLLIVENAQKMGIDVDFRDSELLIFCRQNNEPKFLGRHILSSFAKDGAFIFEIGVAKEVLAQVQQTDFRKLSEKQSEYGVRVNIQNNQSKESDVVVVVETDLACKVTKKNFELQNDAKPSWKLNLKPNESKELHFRIRIDS
ncbi:MAG: hypothetical protein LBO02_00010 [Holosporaceae bacterium]|nr:hypothetical protein [Holosporaceae bacterium]